MRTFFTALLLGSLIGAADARPISLPKGLPSEKANGTIERAIERVVTTFKGWGFSLDPSTLVREAQVFGSVPEAREALAKRFQVDPTRIGDGFAGTVDGDTLLLVSPEMFKRSWGKLYPDRPWREEHWEGLIVHEVAHRAHAWICQECFGSEEAMGPRWFFEGLAILCAGQFEGGASLSHADFERLVREDEKKGLSYPLYGQMIRSLAQRTPVNRLISQAASGDLSPAIEAIKR